MPEVGDVVTYIDTIRIRHKALVTAVWSGEYGAGNPPGLNLVYVSEDKNRNDPFGRQMERATSIVHKSSQPADANCWEE